MSESRWDARAALALALLFLASCGGSSSTVPGGDPASIELSETAVGFASLLDTEDLDATVRDAGGAIIAATVTWTTEASSVVSVSNQGVVMAVGNGTTNVIATAGAFADTATITVQQMAATLSLSPDTLRLASIGDTATIVATVRDAGGSPMSGVAKTFATEDEVVATVDVATGLVEAKANGATTISSQVATGGLPLTSDIRVEVGGSLSPAYLVGGYLGTAYTAQLPAVSGGGTFTYAVTDGGLPGGLSLGSSSGAITGTPTASGVHFFEVTASNGDITVSERYAITISAKPSDAFNLWVAYNGGPMPSANVRTALTNAVDRWEEIVTGDAGAAVPHGPNVFAPGGFCSALVNGTLFNGALIDDVAILVAIDSIDGLNSTLAQAGPCLPTRPQLPVIVQGQMKIDEADANGSATFLQDVITHEIGHVLGIGTLWQDSTVFFGTDSVSYFGQNAKAEWISLGGTGNVPVEPEVGGHWDEAWFFTELMTPSAHGSGTVHPLSSMTIGALLDFGWDAVLGAADPYTLPGCSPACAPARASGEGVPIVDFVIEPGFPAAAFGN